jgi:SAM-dependent methyltransferase
MIGLTGEELRQAGVANAEVRVGDAEHLDIAGESVDVVLCGFCVFLFLQPRVTLDGFRRVLRSGGRFAAWILADRVLDYPWVFDALARPVSEMSSELAPGEVCSSPPRHCRSSSRKPGFDDISTTTAEHRFPFADVDALLGWWRPHFLGPVLSSLGAQDLQRFRTRV